MTKKQVRKLSLEHSNMAPHQKFSLNVKRKPKTVPLLALRDSSHVCLYTRTSTSKNRAAEATVGQETRTEKWTGRRGLCFFTLPCCMNTLPTRKIKCKNKAIGKGKKIAHRFHYSLLIISCISIFSAQRSDIRKDVF